MARKRRGNNEGTIFYEKSTDRWCAEITLPNGKRKRKRSKVKKEVQDWLLTQRGNVQNNFILEEENITVGDYLNRYLDDVAFHTVKRSTLVSYKYCINSHVIPELGNLKLSQLQPHHLQKLYSDKLNAGLSKRTVQYVHAVIRRSLNQAVKMGLLIRNPTDAVTAPKPTRKAPSTLTSKQVIKFFSEVKHHRWYPIYLIAVLMGLRKSEILGLRKQDVDFKTGTVSVNNIVYEVKGKIYQGSPKTESSRRQVAMPLTVQEVLQKHIEKENPENLLFTTSSGKPVSQRNLSRHFYKALEKAGLEHIRFHDLRHTAATLLLKENVHPKIVQEMLGHANITLTLNTYSHVIPSMQKEAAQKMDDLFKQV